MTDLQMGMELSLSALSLWEAPLAGFSFRGARHDVVH